MPWEDWLCHIDYELTSLHSFGAQGLGHFPALFTSLKHYSDFHDDDINGIPHSEIAQYCTIYHDHVFAGLNRRPIWYQPWRRVFWSSTSASALAVWNWESCYWIDMSKRWWGKQKAAHLDSLVRCNRSLPDSFLLHSHRPTYRFHKYCFCMDLRRS